MGMRACTHGMQRLEALDGHGHLLEELAWGPVIGPGTPAYMWAREAMKKNGDLLKQVHLRPAGRLECKHTDLPALFVASLVDPQVAAKLQGCSLEYDVMLGSSWNDVLETHPLWCPAYLRFVESFRGAGDLLDACGSDTLDRLVRMERDPVRAVVLCLLRRDDARDHVRSYIPKALRFGAADLVRRPADRIDEKALSEIGQGLAGRALLLAILKHPGAAELAAGTLRDVHAVADELYGGEHEDGRGTEWVLATALRSGRSFGMWGLVHSLVGLGGLWEEHFAGPAREKSVLNPVRLPGDLSIPEIGGEAFGGLCRRACDEVADWHSSSPNASPVRAARRDLPGGRGRAATCEAPPAAGKDEAGHSSPARACRPAARDMAAELRAIVAGDCVVLLTGEPGTGKGFWARRVHELGGRGGEFVPVLCPTVSKDLFESELFGHRKGAFTGANDDKEGLVEAAAGGTLFLDEIAEFPAHVQAKLLYLLQERTFRRVGETKERGARCRIVLATNRDLVGLVESGAFREDLLARIGTFAFGLPPLRERRDEIPGLLRAFQEELAPTRRRRIRPAECAKLRDAGYDWPGNIRTLRSAVERAFTLSSGRYVSAASILDEAMKLASAGRVG